ncbi:glycoside hydrolase domain-containing protein [Alicyclobacillus pomorum]|uniref:glycoside hydrolase domain-containing protein n=1 Tax=Alicyclobacillus pomorum TaxID=204470 RepID=UPI00041F72A6|nr:glycoside hydrolase domain-containing protein [Alicyclobacillus pomorum]
MTVPANKVILYAADSTDCKMALEAARQSGIPVANVTGNYAKAWNDVASGEYLVLAVGGAALNALYYNPCGWSNPLNQAGGHTPFEVVSAPQTTLPGKNHFVNAAGVSAADTQQIANAFAYFAVHGRFPGKLAKYPHPVAPTEHCIGSANVPCSCAETSPGISPGTSSSRSTPEPQVLSIPSWGVDSAAAVDTSFFDCVVDKYGKPVFWGRYIKPIRGVSDGLTTPEVTFLHERGVRILAIFNNFSRATGYSSGVAEANEGIASARALGMPGGVVIFADVEADYVVDEAWIRGWTDTMTKSQYVPGIYHNPITGGFSQAYCTAVRNDLKVARNLILWSNEREPGITTKTHAPAWHPAAPPCPGRVLAWQYGENGTAGSHCIDTDLVHPSLLPNLW